MDSAKFDRLARALGSAPSRRNVLKGLAGAVVGGAALASFETAEAKVNPGDSCKGKRNKCVENASCKKKGGDRVCKCDNGYRQCGNKCVDRKNDDNHCGRCNRKCKRNETCQNGRCRPDEDATCAGLGEDCTSTGCCAGLACLAGNNFHRRCVLA